MRPSAVVIAGSHKPYQYVLYLACIRARFAGRQAYPVRKGMFHSLHRGKLGTHYHSRLVQERSFHNRLPLNCLQKSPPVKRVGSHGHAHTLKRKSASHKHVWISVSRPRMSFLYQRSCIPRIFFFNKVVSPPLWMTSLTSRDRSDTLSCRRSDTRTTPYQWGSSGLVVLGCMHPRRSIGCVICRLSYALLVWWQMPACTQAVFAKTFNHEANRPGGRLA